MASSEFQPSRIERILMYIAAGLTLVSVLSIAAVLIAQASGMPGESFTTGIWPLVAFFPYAGLPAAVAALIALTILSIIKRTRQNPYVRDDDDGAPTTHE